MRRVVVAAVAVVAGLAVASSQFDRSGWQYDLTADRSLSLATQTEEVVDAVDRDVRVTVVARRTDAGRAEAAALLDRYRDRNRRISFRLLDPDESRGEVGRLGVDPVLGGIAVEDGERIERGATAAEQDVTSAIARLLRDRQPSACFTAGHGEPSIGQAVDSGLSQAGAVLAANGYRVATVDLLTAPAADLDACDAVVVVNPSAPLADGAVAALRAFLDDDGRMLVLGDPASAVDLSPVVADHGIRFDRGLVFEGEPTLRLGDDPLTPVIPLFSGGTPVTRRLAPIVLPGVQRVTTVDVADSPGLAATVVARTSEVSYLDREPAAPAFDPAADVQGPVDVAAVADRSSNEGGTVHRSRVVAVGDADFATNGFVGQAGHSRFLVQALDWLTLDEDLVSVSANVPTLRPLQFTPDRVRAALAVSVGVVPGLFLLAGLLVWALRRPL